MRPAVTTRAILITSCLAVCGLLPPPQPAFADGRITSPGNASDTDAEDDYRFVVVADSRGQRTGINPDALSAVFAAIAALDPEPKFVFFGGDLVYGRTSVSRLHGELRRWRDVIALHYPPNKVYPVFGGHERTAATNAESTWKGFKSFFDPKTQGARGGEPGMACHYYERRFNPARNRPNFSRTVYYCDYGGDRFFVLNNDCIPPAHSATGGPADAYGCVGHELGCGQLNWLKDKLVDNGKRHNFFFHHEPAFGTAAHDADSYRDDTCPQTPRYVMDRKKAPRNDFVRLLGFNNGTAMFAGHEHQYTWRAITHDFVDRPLNNPDGTDRSLALLLKADPVGQGGEPAVAWSWDGAAAARRYGRAPNLRLWWTSATGPPDWRGSIRRSQDDAEEFQRREGEVDLTSDALDLMRDRNRGPQRFVALRWNNVPIPAGATIQKAFLYFTAKESSPGGPRVKIMADASPYAFPFSQCRKDLLRRPRGAAKVRWQVGPWTRGRQYRTPDLSRIVQGLIDRHGYGSRFPGQIPEIKTGSCGAPWKETSCSRFMGQVDSELIRLADYQGQGMPHHFAVVDVRQDGASVAVRSWDGTSLPVP